MKQRIYDRVTLVAIQMMEAKLGSKLPEFRNARHRQRKLIFGKDARASKKVVA